MVVNAQFDFAADHHVVFKEAVEGVIDRAFGGVFHRNHAEIHSTGDHFAKHFVNCGHRQTDDGVAEMLHRSGLGERPLRAKIGNLERLFQRQAGRHDFAEQTRHFFVAQRSAIAFHDSPEHRSFALRTIEYRHLAFSQRGHLDPGHFLGTAGTLADQFQNLLIEAVDTDAKRLEFLLGHQPCSFSKSFM